MVYFATELLSLVVTNIAALRFGFEFFTRNIGNISPDGVLVHGTETEWEHDCVKKDEEHFFVSGAAEKPKQYLSILGKVSRMSPIHLPRSLRDMDTSS